MPNSRWWIAFLISLSMLGVLGVALGYLFWMGTGIWGLNNPIGWGWAIVNFVFWVGIGHAGTLISAILFLFRQKWRTSINRFAEAMTIFAVICALLFPTIHVGRVWLLYWALPIPNQMQMWPNFRSPLLWDVFAVSTYFTVSLLFWYVGLIPDLATMRDRATTKIRRFAYGLFALGWRGSMRHWLNYEKAYLILAGLATPLVLSVHTIVSFDFAVSQLPGWHTTIFPPYFVAGAIFSGFAMVLTLLIPARAIFDLEHIITIKHLENMAKIILLTGTMVGYAYAMEFFIAWYSGNPYESFAFINRAFGPYAWAYWIMVSCNVITPQLFWFKKHAAPARPSGVRAVIFVNIGMWFERFVITVTSLSRDFLPSSWDYFSPTLIDILTYVGSFGLFFTLFCLFVRYLPMIAIAEIKSVLPQANPHYDPDHDPHRERRSAHCAMATPKKNKTFGLLAEYDSAADVYHACEKVRDAGYKRWDSYTPFPVHNLDKAMGLKPSVLPWIVFACGMTGAACGLLLQWWSSTVAYPIIIAGKPLFSWQAFVPVTFELGVLFSRLRRGVRHARAQPPAEALPPALQLRPLRARHRRQVLHRDRGERPQVRRREDPQAARGPPAPPRSRRSRTNDPALPYHTPRLALALVWTLAWPAAEGNRSEEPPVHLIRTWTSSSATSPGGQPLLRRSTAPTPSADCKGRAARAPVPGTVAVGFLKDDDELHRGRGADGRLFDTLPEQHPADPGAARPRPAALRHLLRALP